MNLFEELAGALNAFGNLKKTFADVHGAPADASQGCSVQTRRHGDSLSFARMGGVILLTGALVAAAFQNIPNNTQDNA